MTDHIWSDDLTLGVDAIDNEHHLQVTLLDEIARAIDGSPPAGTVVELLDRLIEYTNAHFLAEQLMMRLHAYPLYAAHVAEHDGLLADARRLRDAVGRGDTAAARPLVDALTRWLTTHIRGMDRTYAEFTAQPGVTPPV